MKLPYEKRLTIFMAIVCAMMIVMAHFDRPTPTIVKCDAPKFTQEDISEMVSGAVIATLERQGAEEEPEPEVVDERAYSGPYTDEEIKYLAMLTTAEAGNQPVLGKRLVIDTVLNRVEHSNFPNTITEVINQTNQFSPVLSGSIYRYPPTEEMIQLVREEIEHRTDPDVMFFRANEYGPYGVPMYKLGGHYFSSYD